MKVEIICLGKSKTDFITSGQAFYLKRLSTLAKVSITEIDTNRLSSLDENSRKRKEAELVLEKIKDKDFLVVLDENGKTFSSDDFAKFIEKKMSTGISKIVLAIGGTFGWDKNIFDRAQLKLSLSNFTFTYEMSRIILIEQLYRAFSIIKGTSYHKA